MQYVFIQYDTELHNSALKAGGTAGNRMSVISSVKIQSRYKVPEGSAEDCW